MSYLQYLQNVLGVRKIVWPATSANDSSLETTAVPLAETRLVFLGQAQGGPPLSQMEVFQKMVQAMRLEENEYQVLEVTSLDLIKFESELHENQWIISFSLELSRWLSLNRPRLQVLTTSHPAEFEKKPQLKRAVWETLKQAMKNLGLEARLQS